MHTSQARLAICLAPCSSLVGGPLCMRSISLPVIGSGKYLKQNRSHTKCAGRGLGALAFL